jgi:hypothetical protein
MVGRGRPSRIEIAEFHGGDYAKLNDINLRWIFSKNQEEILKYMAHHRLIANKMKCSKCMRFMSLNKYDLIRKKYPVDV